MIKSTIIAAIASGALILGSFAARAHCDTVDGPVAKAVERALASGNIYPVLAYAPASAESEIKSSFEAVRKVRGLNEDARVVADRSFMETVIRLHRAGEGAPYTGLKGAGEDFGPVVRAAEQAIDSGDVTRLQTVISEQVEHALAEKFARVRELKKVSLDPKTAAEVPHARERISAELSFITFAESIRQAGMGKGSEHHAD